MSDPGDIVWVSNTNNSDTVPNAGSNLDLTWNQTDQNFGVTNASGTFTLDTGIWLLFYSEYFDTTNTTNNERIEIQGEIHSSTNGVLGGYGQGMIRKSSGDQEAVVRGSMIYEVTAATEDVFVRTYRTDNSTSGTVNRVQNGGGNWVALKLDDSEISFKQVLI